MKRTAARWIAAITGTVLIGGAIWWYVASRPPEPVVLSWESGSSQALPPLVFDSADHPSMVELRAKYDIDGLLTDSKDDLARLVRLTTWASIQWSHSPSEQPSKQDPLTILAEAKAGKSFRCVEYATVVKGLATAAGMPARSLGLKRGDAATAEYGAGHVVAEVWLPDQQKWVFADGQFGYVPVSGGRPLNAVELQQAIAGHDPKLGFLTGDGLIDSKAAAQYTRWVAPYLYYFDYQFDQRQYDTKPASGLMLVPKGAPDLTVFQRTNPLAGFVYVSDPQLFYRAPGNTAQGNR